VHQDRNDSLCTAAENVRRNRENEFVEVKTKVDVQQQDERANKLPQVTHAAMIA